MRVRSGIHEVYFFEMAGNVSDLLALELNTCPVGE
jgi:hypothetical protein